MAAASGSGCSLGADPDAWCPPVDPGGNCSPPSEVAFKAHALESATAWPQLSGLSITAGPVIEGFDEAAGQPTWVVPLFADGQVVAASRFLPSEGYVKLGEIALYQPPWLDFPIRTQASSSCSHQAMVAPTPALRRAPFSSYQWHIDQLRQP